MPTSKTRTSRAANDAASHVEVMPVVCQKLMKTYTLVSLNQGEVMHLQYEQLPIASWSFLATFTRLLKTLDPDKLV